MLRIDPNDDDFAGLVGATVAASKDRSTQYRIVRQLGGGATASAMLALAERESGVTPVVLKLLRPSFIRAAGGVAGVSVRKEAAALKRLNERVPATPFVVRLLDLGVTPIAQGEGMLHVDWLALEYVHGGSEGSTLHERVGYSVKKTGAGFDPLRATDAIRCMAAGLTAVHEVGVIHRDLKPTNVLCCGFGTQEILKISDFGLARPAGVAATFGNAAIGTIGYAAPEQLFGDNAGIGPATDVFGLAAVVYFLLTAEEYLPARSLGEAMRVIQSPSRKTLLAAPRLADELRRNPGVCQAIDRALAQATSLAPEDRHTRPGQLAEQLLAPLFQLSALQSTTVSRLPERAEAERAPTGSFTWLTRQRPWRGGVVQSGAWDADGRCLVASTEGLSFHGGRDWRPVLTAGSSAGELRGATRIGPARWLLVGDAGRMFEWSAEGLKELAPCPDRSLRLEAVSGTYNDLIVGLARSSAGQPVLLTRSSVGWLDPRPVTELAQVNAIARSEPTRWLLAGRGADGAGSVAVYSPLQSSVKLLEAPPARAYVACAGDPERGIGIAVGTDGACLVHEHGAVCAERVLDGAHLSAAAVDVAGGLWAGAAGQLAYRAPGGGWQRVWHAESWAPFVAMFADAGMLLALTSDGAVLEGQR